MPDISIIIVNWNTKDLLRACLSSIYKYPPSASYEIFVVDNASTDGSPEMVRKEFPRVKLIENAENLGFAKANNQAISQSESEFVLLLNSDAEVLDGSIDGLYRLLQIDDRAAIAGPLIKNPGDRLEESCGNIQTPFAILATKLARLSPGVFGFMRRWASHRVPSGVEQVGWLTGACMMLRRTALQEVGLFDEKIFMYFEDVDLCYRMRKAGWRIVVDTSSAVFHHRGASGNGRKKRSSAYTRSRRYFYGKHFCPLYGQFRRDSKLKTDVGV